MSNLKPVSVNNVVIAAASLSVGMACGAFAMLNKDNEAAAFVGGFLTVGGIQILRREFRKAIMIDAAEFAASMKK